MQHAQLRDQIVERIKQTVPQEFLESSMMTMLLNVSYAAHYPKALLSAAWFYQTSAAATISSSVVTKPANCQKVLGLTLANIVNPLGGFLTKQATPVDVRQWASVNLYQPGTASNPKFREDGSSVYLVPYQNSVSANFTGTFHFLRNFNMLVDGTDDDFELSYPNGDALPLFPWWFEEDVIFFAVKLAKLRTRGMMTEPSAIAMFSQDYTKTMSLIRAGQDPLPMWNATLDMQPSGIQQASAQQEQQQ